MKRLQQELVGLIGSLAGVPGIAERLNRIEHALGASHELVLRMERQAFDVIEQVLPRVDERTASIERRLDGVEHVLGASHESLLRIDARTASIEDRLTRIEHALGAIHEQFPARTNPWWFLENATEPNVQLHIHDLVKPGDIVFDVGANEGQITQVLSRAVGPLGKVVAFEANESILPCLTANVVQNAQVNCHLYYGAVMRSSGEWFGLLEAGAASVVIPGNGEGAVPSIALDDFVKHYGLVPSFVKIDVEGNEIEVLSGFQATVAEHHPTIIFEHNIGKDAPIDFLRSHGYETFCTAQHTPVRTSADCLPGATQRNILAIHSSKIGETRFARRVSKTPIHTFRASEFRETSAINIPGAITTEGLSFDVSPGRYLFNLDATAEADNPLFYRIIGRGHIRQYYSKASHLLTNERDISIDLRPGISYRVEVGEIAATRSLQINALTLERIDFA